MLRTLHCAVILVAAASGCASDPPTITPAADLGVASRDRGFAPPRDLGKRSDVWVRPDQVAPDVGADAKGADGGCRQPKVTCTKRCAAKELCTEAGSGVCVERAALKGKADGKAVYVALSLAYLACWQKSPASDTLCSTLDTCALEGTITEAAIKDWVCKKAQVVDFKDKATYDAVRSIGGCQLWQTYRPRWISLPRIEARRRATICLSYDKNPLWQFDRVAVHACKSFPLP